MPKILVCAPSNAAADHIAIKIIKEGLRNENGRFEPKIIRVGVSEDSSETKIINVIDLIKWVSKMEEEANTTFTIATIYEHKAYFEREMEKSSHDPMMKK